MKYINTVFLVLLMIVILMMFSRYVLKSGLSKYHEGFTQNERYISKSNCDIYDDFYVSIYDNLNETESRVLYDYKNIIKTIQFDKKDKVLDIGSGSGHFLNLLENQNVDGIGLEKSKAMIEHSTKLYPNIYVIQGDAYDAKTFDHSTFSNICLFHFTFYEFDNKKSLIRNCFHWLRNNGHLIVHLVNKKEYNPLVSAANPFSNTNFQKYTKERVKKARIDFHDFEYLEQIDFKNDNRVLIKETFTDALTQNVRENENTLFMDSLQDNLQVFLQNGFIVKGQFSYKNDENQFIYIFEKTG